MLGQIFLQTWWGCSPQEFRVRKTKGPMEQGSQSVIVQHGSGALLGLSVQHSLLLGTGRNSSEIGVL